jgi:hypothetical protein
MAPGKLVLPQCVMNPDELQDIFQIEQADQLAVIHYAYHLARIPLHPFKQFPQRLIDIRSEDILSSAMDGCELLDD